MATAQSLIDTKITEVLAFYKERKVPCIDKLCELRAVGTSTQKIVKFIKDKFVQEKLQSLDTMKQLIYQQAQIFIAGAAFFGYNYEFDLTDELVEATAQAIRYIIAVLKVNKIC